LPIVVPTARTATALLAASALLLALACGSDSADEAATPAPTQVIASTAPSGQATLAPAAGTPLAAQQPLAPIRVERAFPALSFVRLTGMYELPDGSNRFLVTEQRGVISIFDNRPDVQRATVFMDLSGRVSTAGNEEGLLGFAFAPDFDRSRAFYVYYSAAQGRRRTVVSRFTAGADRSSGDPASESVILEVDQPFPNHKGGQIAFGPDGFLYIGLGDGGSANDPGNRAQNLNELLGKILRIDVSGTAAGLNYRIPADNPFVGRSGARPEIFAYGLRNPWRFSFDQANGDLWAGDVGQNAFEEIDLVRKGQNYGWNRIEAEQCRGGGACDKSDTVLPVIFYPTGANCSVTGGFVYRGGRIPQVQGAYIYGDYCSGKIWALRHDGSRTTEQMEVADTDFRISSFAVDRSGTLYGLAHGEAPGGGGIFRLIAP